ncbi:hypothetical protein BBJ28_00022009 [Nothophytophthora sp. Chile5]|nr:hypothetical protein BBJ28_00022009 [Nothophytophthora sp. Chile5]
MVATSIALSSTSGRSGGVKRSGHGKPHVLGGSNNLVSERNRREKAEAALQSTKLSLRTVAQDLAPQVQQLAQAVKELRLLIAKLQEVQDEQAAEIRLLQHERLRTIEDSVESVRSEISRAKEQQHISIQSHVSKIDDLDEKLFALDKELLKLKLALPSAVAAQIPASFTDQYSSSSTAITLGNIEINRSSGLEVSMKLQELVMDLEALYV